MKTIKALVSKDLYEYYNRFSKSAGTMLFLMAIPVVLIYFVGISISLVGDSELYKEIIIIIYILILYCETTLFQVYKDVKEGVYERLFINRYVKSWEIFASKFLSNLVYTTLAFVVLVLLNGVASTFIKIDSPLIITSRLVLSIPGACLIGTGVAFINSLIISNEKNSFTYGISVCGIYLGFFNIMDWLLITNYFIQQLLLVIVGIAIAALVVLLLSNNKFIRRK